MIYYYILLLLISIYKILAQDLRLYSPHSVFSLKLDTTSCENGQTSSIISFQQNTITYAIVNEGYCGFSIYSLSQLDTPVVEHKEYRQQFKCTQLYLDQDSLQLWASFSNGITYIYKVDMSLNKQKILLLNSIITPKNDITFFIKRNPINLNQFFFFGSKSLFIYQASNQNNQLQLLQTLDQDFANAFQISIIGQMQFIFVATQNKGLQLIQVVQTINSSDNSFSYSLGNICYLNPSIYTIISFDMLNPNVVVMLQIVLGAYVYDISGYLNNSGQDCSTTNFKLLYRFGGLTLGGKLILSADKKYAFSSIKSVGIYIYEITQSSATQIQIIWQTGNAGDHILSGDEQILLSTNSLGFLGYQLTKPNLNNIQPNLLLNYQQMQLVPAVPKPGQDRDCIYNESNKLLFLISPSYSFLVMKYQGNGIYENKFSQLNSGLRFIVYTIMLKDNKTVIAATRDNGICIMDFTDPSQPIYVKEGIKFGINKINLSTMYISNDESFLALTDNTRAIFVDISDPMNPTLISTYDITTDGVLPPLKRAVLSVDNKIIYLGSNNDCVISLDISQLKTPVFLQKLQTEGVNEMRVTQDGKHLIYAQIYRGMVVVDIQNPSQMKIISSVQVIGAALSVQLIDNDQYILMASTGNPSIKLIDFRDRNNPIGIQLFYLQRRSYDFVQICKTNSDQTIFVSSNSNMIALNLKNNLNLHTQIYNVERSISSNQEKLTILDPNEPFLVGQKIKMTFLNVKDIAQVSITDAYHYINDQIQQLPSWIVFSSMSNELYFEITKDSLNVSSEQKKSVTSQSQVVLRVLRQILDNTFVNSYLQLTSAQSLILKNACIKKRYIDSNSYPSSQFEPLGYFELDPADLVSITTDANKLKAISQFVMYTLKQNIVFYTIQFQIKPSLSVDLTNLLNPIATTQNQLSIYLTCIDPKQGKFVFIQYPSVLVVYSELQNQIKIEGTLANINSIIHNKIKFSNSTDVSKIKFTLQVQDGINFNFIQSYNLIDLPIIQLQKPVYIDKSNNLQSYFNNKYEHGELQINSYFSFQIPSSYFISDSNYPLTYKVYQLNSKEFKTLKNKSIDQALLEINPISLPKSLWIQFSTSDQVFSGVPESNNLFNDYYLMINVTDGYTFVVEPLFIQVSQVPFSYIIQLIIQIGGPLFGILGLWRYKYIFFNYFCKNYYLYSREIAYVGQDYHKHIYLYGNSLQQAQKICNIFFPKILKNKFIEDQISLLIAQQRKKSISNNVLSIMSERFNQTVEQINDEEQQMHIENLKNALASNTQKLNKVNNVEKSNILSKSGSEYILNEAKKFERRITKNINSVNQEQQELLLFEKDGHVSVAYIQDQLKNQLQNSSYKQNLGLFSDLSNPKSGLSKIVSGLAVHYILKKIKAAQIIFNKMRDYAMSTHKTRDWYKIYVDIETSNKYEEICFFNQFKINQYKFQKAFNESILFIQNIDQMKRNNEKLDINLNSFCFLIPLVEDSIVTTAQGISFDKPGITFKSQGESINCDQHNIKTIKAYQKVNEHNKKCMQQFRIQEYKEKFLIQNQMLPSWVKRIELVDNIIIIQGIPERQNIGTTLFKILNEYNIVQFAFEIEIRSPQFSDTIISQNDNILVSDKYIQRKSIVKEQTINTQEAQHLKFVKTINTKDKEDVVDLQMNDIFIVDQITTPPILFQTNSNQIQLNS